MPALSTSPSSRFADGLRRARDRAAVGDVEEQLRRPGRRRTLGPRTAANTRQPARASRSAHAAPIPEEAPVTRTERSAKDRGGDLGALRRPG